MHRNINFSAFDVIFEKSLFHGVFLFSKHKDPDYSAAYIVIKTDRPDNLTGCGLAFTLGRGTEIGECFHSL